MGLLRAIGRLLDAIEAIAALAALVVLVILLATGKVPHDLELWAYAACGLSVLLGLALLLWSWGPWRHRSP
jgi:hypothetical protein